MAELPELEILKDTLSSLFAGRKLLGVSVRQPAILKTVALPLSEVSGRKLVRVERIGKHLALLWDSERFLVVHLMLTGWMRICPSTNGFSKQDEVGLSWEDGRDLRIYEAGTTRMAAVYLVNDPQEVPSVARTGIEPLSQSFTPQALTQLLRGRRMTLKTFLTDPKLVAGIGNAFSDEILYEARLSPYDLSGRLQEDEMRKLHQSIIRVLSETTDRMRQRVGDRFPKKADRDFFKVHGRDGETCAVCGSPIAAIWKAQSATYYCPGCQAGGKAYNDRRFDKFLK